LIAAEAQFSTKRNKFLDIPPILRETEVGNGVETQAEAKASVSENWAIFAL
jgi:hypothetical protein